MARMLPSWIRCQRGGTRRRTTQTPSPFRAAGSQPLHAGGQLGAVRTAPPSAASRRHLPPGAAELNVLSVLKVEEFAMDAPSFTGCDFTAP
jgi:hypothetical protein